MNNNTFEKDAPHSSYTSEWIWEVLLVIIIAPAIAYGAFGIGNLPVV